MSVPYGQPPVAPPPGPTSSPAGGLGLGKILALVAGGLGLVIYFLSFADDAGYFSGIIGILLLGGGLLAAASVLPKAPATLVPAAVLVVTGTLSMLVGVASGIEVPAMAVVALILAFLQSAAGVLALLADVGVVKMAPRPSSYPQQWGPQPGAYPSGPGQSGYPGPSGYPAQSGYPGQQPAGSPAGAFPSPPQQPYVPHTVQYGQPGQYANQPGQYDQPGASNPYADQPGPYGDQPGASGQPGEQPRTPPGDFGSPGKS